jgi:hypothetical protein
MKAKEENSNQALGIRQAIGNDNNIVNKSKELKVNEERFDKSVSFEVS